MPHPALSTFVAVQFGFNSSKNDGVDAFEVEAGWLACVVVAPVEFVPILEVAVSRGAAGDVPGGSLGSGVSEFDGPIRATPANTTAKVDMATAAPTVSRRCHPIRWVEEACPSSSNADDVGASLGR